VRVRKDHFLLLRAGGGRPEANGAVHDSMVPHPVTTVEQVGLPGTPGERFHRRPMFPPLPCNPTRQRPHSRPTTIPSDAPVRGVSAHSACPSTSPPRREERPVRVPADATDTRLVHVIRALVVPPEYPARVVDDDFVADPPVHRANGVVSEGFGCASLGRSTRPDTCIENPENCIFIQYQPFLQRIKGMERSSIKNPNK